MKKTLVALAAIASVSAYAQSTVEIYGTLDIGQIKLSGQQAGLNNSNNQYPVSQSTTGLANVFARQGTSTNNMGFRGKEDLGGGLYAGFNLQTGGLDTSTGSSALAFSRESNLSIGSSSWGELKIGRSSSTVCTIGCSFDYNYIGSGSAAGLIGLSPANFRKSSRRSDQIEFKSLPVSGITFYGSMVQRGDHNADSSFATSGGGTYSTTSSIDGTSTTVNDYKNMFTYGATYVNGPLRVAAVAETASVNSLEVRTGSFLAVEYNFGMFTANIQSTINPYKPVSPTGDGTGTAISKVGSVTYDNVEGVTYGKGTVVAIKVPVGNGTYGVQHANNDETGVKATEVFAQYALSKRTTLYAYNTKLSGTTAVTRTTANYMNLTTTKSATQNAIGLTAVPADPTIFAFGIRHTF